MRPAFRRLAVAVPSALAAFASLTLVAAQDAPRAPAVLDDVLRLVRDRFGADPGDVYARAAAGLVRELGDPYSELLTPADLEAFERGALGRYAGVGMQVSPVGDRVYVGEVFPGGPAARAGVPRGARLRRVAGHVVDGVPLDTVVRWLRGAPGTEVAVDAEPRAAGPAAGAAAPAHFVLRRAAVRVPAVPYTVTTRGVVYVPLPSVSGTAGPDVEAALLGAERAGARGVVLDLRGNTGGAVDQAVHVASALLSAGEPVVEIRERAGRTRVPAVGAERPVALPVVVLQDGRSASAAEIIAGALQDAGRARVVGTRSYGKGLAQTVFPLEGGYALKLTTAKWYTPSGRSIHRDRTAADSARHGADDAAVEGGILPDVRAEPDTLAGAARLVALALGRRPAAAGRALAETAHALADSLVADAARRGAPADSAFRAPAAWREGLRRALARGGVAVDAAEWAGAAPWVTRLLEREVAGYAFGAAAARARELAYDRPYQVADSLLRAPGRAGTRS